MAIPRKVLLSSAHSKHIAQARLTSRNHVRCMAPCMYVNMPKHWQNASSQNMHPLYKRTLKWSLLMYKIYSGYRDVFCSEARAQARLQSQGAALASIIKILFSTEIPGPVRETPAASI